MAINVTQLAMQSGLALTTAPRDYQDHRNRGDSVASAGFHTAPGFLENSLLSVPSALAVGVVSPLIGLAAVGIQQGTRRYNMAVRQTATPFSQQFHHNQMTSHLQSYGLSHMGGSGSLGNEASLMYGRYGR